MGNKIAVIGGDRLFKIFKSTVNNPKDFVHVNLVHKARGSYFKDIILLADWNATSLNEVNRVLIELVEKRLRK